MNGNFSGVLAYAGGFRRADNDWSGVYEIKDGEIYLYTSVKNSQIDMVTNRTFHVGPFRTIRFTSRTEWVADNGSSIRVLDANKNVLAEVRHKTSFTGATTDLDVSGINQQVFLSFLTWGCGIGGGGAHGHIIYISKIEFLT